MVSSRRDCKAGRQVKRMRKLRVLKGVEHYWECVGKILVQGSGGRAQGAR